MANLVNNRWVQNQVQNKVLNPGMNYAWERFQETGLPKQANGFVEDTIDHYVGKLPPGVAAPIYNNVPVNPMMDAMNHSGFVPPILGARSQSMPTPTGPLQPGMRSTQYFGGQPLGPQVGDPYAVIQPDYDITFDRIGEWNGVQKVSVTWISPGSGPKNVNLGRFLDGFPGRAKNEIEQQGFCIRVTFDLDGRIQVQDTLLEKAIFLRLRNLIKETCPARILLIMKCGYERSRQSNSHAHRFDAQLSKEAEHCVATMCYKIATQEKVILEVDIIPCGSHG